MTVPGSPADWLLRARSDLNLAQAAPPADVLLEDLCFHAQQAAEKALKAVLVAHSVPPPRTHSINRLLELLPPELPVPMSVRRAVALTDYAVTVRYPGVYEAVGTEELSDAVALAEGVVAWVVEQLESHADFDSERT